MGNVLHVLRRDLARLVKTPAALVVVLALLVLPSAYTWYNVIAFWDPYGSTGNVRVAVVNEDAGGASEVTGQIDVGDMIVEELVKNDQLDWCFTDRETAMAELSAGKSYAAFVIPERFTEDLLTVLTGDFTQPELEYYVNEKAGPVSPKITDTGATALDEQVNAAFTASVSDAIVQAIDGAAADADAAFSDARSRAASDIAQVSERIATARSALGEGIAAVESARAAIADAKGVLERVKVDIAAASGALAEVADAAAQAQEKLGSVNDAIGRANAAVQEQLGALAELAGRIDEAASGLEDVDAAATAHAMADAIGQATGAMQEALPLFGDAAPSISGHLETLSSAASSLSSVVSGQQARIDEAGLVLDGLDVTLASAGAAATQTDTLLAGLEGDLSTVQADVLALEGSSALSTLAESGLNAQQIASFMKSPTTIETVELYSLNAYGSAMAPLFMSLTFWIGAFMLVVIMRQEVDSEGVPRLTSTQRYVSRFALFSALAAMQAVVCCVGVLVIGVQATSVLALLLASVGASLAYMSVIYALSYALRHIGKGLCIVLVFAQIPGATGLYPIEMTSPFFQTVYYAFPFTYGIDALREAIFGMYGAHYAVDMLVLAAFFAAFLAIGIVAGSRLTNVSRTMARQVREGGLYNGEDVAAPPRPYRLSQLFRALSEHEDYRSEIQRRYERFTHRYPKLLRGALVAGIAVPVVLAIVFALTPTEKVVLLTAWLIWLVGILVFLVVVESLRSSFERQLDLGGLSDERLIDLGAANGGGGSIGASAGPESVDADSADMQVAADSACVAPAASDSAESAGGAQRAARKGGDDA